MTISNLCHYQQNPPDLKSKTLKMGKDEEPLELNTDNMTIKTTDQYKYLGEIINTKNNITDHLKELGKKSAAALQTTLFIAGNENLRKIQMETISGKYSKHAYTTNNNQRSGDMGNQDNTNTKTKQNTTTHTRQR